MVSAAPRIAVVGAGIAGLVAARHLADAGAQVTVFEATEQVGGQIRSRRIDARIVDLGAESLHLATPGIGSLLDDLGLGPDLVAAAPGPTWIATGRRLRRLPTGMTPAGPARLGSVATSRILSPVGLLRASLEPLRGRTPWADDVAVGAYLTHRFGRQLTERLVDPLLGSLHAGNVDRLSLAAATPQLEQLARRHRSLLSARRRSGRASPGPGFATLRGGLGRLPDALAADPRIEVRRGRDVRAIETDVDGHRLRLGDGSSWSGAAVVVAVPAPAAAAALASLDPETASELAGIRSASVATVVSGYDPRVAGSLSGTGLLVPSTSPYLLKAATFLSAKWPHLGEEPTFLVRLSAGRVDDPRMDGLDDAQLVDRLHGELAALTGLGAPPRHAVVRRWPAAMPQLEVGHRRRLQTVREQLAGHRIALAGASYDGVGISNCLRSAEAAAHLILEATVGHERVRA